MKGHCRRISRPRAGVTEVARVHSSDTVQHVATELEFSLFSMMWLSPLFIMVMLTSIGVASTLTNTMKKTIGSSAESHCFSAKKDLNICKRSGLLAVVPWIYRTSTYTITGLDLSVYYYFLTE